MIDTRVPVIWPELISIEQVPVSVIVPMQKRMSRAVWRPAPGRKLGFLVKHDGDVAGLLFLASPVINLAARDEYLGLPKEGRGKALRNYMDLSVCVSAQPVGWYWNFGKLCALLATTLGDAVEERYGDPLVGIVTTSLYGRGSQYNRIYRFLGYTKGYGHEQYTDEQYRGMLSWMEQNGYPIPGCRFGEGSNARMRRIAAYRKASGDKSVSLVHGHKRGVYYHPATPPSERASIISGWYERWGRPRYERKCHERPPYLTGTEVPTGESET